MGGGGSFTDDEDSDIELHSTEIEEEIHYTTAAWIILQAWLHRRAAGGSDADFWAIFQTTTASYDYAQEMSDVEAESLLDQLAGLPGFASTFLGPGALSIPMLALTRLDLAEGGDTGSPRARRPTTIRL